MIQGGNARDMAIATFAPIARYLESICPPEPDAVLLKRFARSADEAAFAEIVRRHGPAVFGVCRRILRDGHAAEDAFQVAFLLLAKKAGSLRCPERLACWLHGVAYRTALKQRSWFARRQMRERPFDEASFVARDAPDAEMSDEIDAAIQGLPAKYRIPVVLCYLQGLTNAQAAASLGCPANTIATRLARARERLRERLTKQGLTVAVSSALAAGTARNAVCMVNGMKSLSLETIALMEGVRSAMFWNKVKIIVATVTLVTLTGFGAGRLAFRASAEQPASGQAAQPPAAAVHSEIEQRIPATELGVSSEDPRNFVVYGTTTENGLRIVRAAEMHRRAIAKLWLGKELPNWTKQCPIRVTIGGEAASGATSFSFAAGFNIQGMQLSGSIQDVIENRLPHEVTHAVIADHFRKPIPRWADEGIAILSERTDEQKRHDQVCKEMLKQGRAIRISSLFGMTEYSRDATVTYAEGYSVVHFLMGLKGRAPLLEFVKTGMSDGWELAAKRWYDFESVSALEHAWIESLRHDSDEDAPSKPDPNSPMPPPAISPESIPATQAVLPTPVSPEIPPPSAELPTVPVQQAPQLSDAPSVAWPTGAVPPPIASALPSRLPSDWKQTQLPIAVVDASLDGDQIVCKFAKTTVMVPVTSYRAVGNKAQPVTSYVGRTIQEEHRYSLKTVEVFGVDGKPIAEKDLVARLAKETQAIFVESRRYDPRLPGLLKPDALVISVPQSFPPAPAVPSAPPASASR